ncbi:unnamed protein product [Dovyalis caffra]|uniref:Uncharacterized protein n=1 Tax=Dovyalis caffra TaxID=77055 RepID=A0AAV1RDD4_9ROSI|nr:unnamed protein product [Dovyalis caffra]
MFVNEVGTMARIQQKNGHYHIANISTVRQCIKLPWNGILTVVSCLELTNIHERNV